MIQLGRTAKVASMSFDTMKSCLVVILDNGDKVEIDPEKITEHMPKLKLEEKIEDLRMMIHYIDRRQLASLNHIFSQVPIFDKGIKDAREKLKMCKKTVCVKKWQAISKTYVDEKNNLREVRLTIGLLSRKKAELRAEIARLGYNPDEQTGSSEDEQIESESK